MSGKQMYDAFMLSVTPNPTMVYSLTAGPYYAEVNFYPPGEIKKMKKDIEAGNHFKDWAGFIMRGGEPEVLDYCDMGEEFATNYQNNPTDPDDTEISFDNFFQNCIPLAFSIEEEEFLFIDASNDDYPVMFWNHECIVKVSKDFASFISIITPEI